MVMASPIVTKDSSAVAQTLDRFVGGLQSAVDNKWLSKKSAGESFRTFISQLGIEISESKEERDAYENEEPVKKEVKEPENKEQKPEDKQEEKEE